MRNNFKGFVIILPFMYFLFYLRTIHSPVLLDAPIYLWKLISLFSLFVSLAFRYLNVCCVVIKYVIVIVNWHTSTMSRAHLL